MSSDVMGIVTANQQSIRDPSTGLSVCVSVSSGSQNASIRILMSRSEPRIATGQTGVLA